MCGIFGYVGSRQASPLVLEGLKKLEYRGYDSAGLAVLDEGGLAVRRAVGKLANLEALAAKLPAPGTVGMGHTRWATHGAPSEVNAHPHGDCAGRISVVHNGIIENHAELKERLRSEGHVFRSQTDTEVLAHLIERQLRGAAPGPERLIEALRAALVDARGAYAVAVLWEGAPGAIAAARLGSPLVIGLGQDEQFLASDVPAFLKHTRRAVFLEDGELALLTAEGVSFRAADGRRVEKIALHVQWDSTAAEKSGFRHFMLKEIHEQVDAARNTLSGRLFPLNDGVLERETGLPRASLSGVKQVHIVACGTAHHAGIVGRYLLERYARLPTQVETASEFRYRQPLLPPGTLVLAISQSGETADTIAAARLAREQGARVMSVCNTLGASLTRVSDYNFYTHCGPERGVASTKAFLGQLIALDVLTLHLAVSRGAMSEPAAKEWAEELKRLPDLIARALASDAQVIDAARSIVKAHSALFIGRTVNYPTAIEGALKLKEISYMHAEGYPAGEMKHGPLALIDEKVPVIAVATDGPVFEKVLSNIEEARARGGKVIGVVGEGDTRLDGKVEHKLEVPETLEFLSPAVNIVPLQLLAYHVADLRGCDVDMPRNLAKSVTVE